MNDLKKALKDQNYSLRTQISLSVSLRKMIDAKRKIYGETLAEYLRKSALMRLLADEVEKDELKSLAAAVVDSVPKSKSGWSKIKNVSLWQRKERRQEDKHRKI